MSISDNIIDLLELEDVEITGIETTTDANYLHLEVPLRDHACPACGALTHCIHDYRE